MKNRLSYLRHLSGLTQQDLADKLMIGRSTYSAYETGKHDFTLDSLILLADYYNVSLDYILCRSDIPKSNFILSETERFLLEAYSQLNTTNRQTLLAVAQALFNNQK